MEVRHKPEEGEVGDDGWTPRVIDMERGVVGGVFWGVQKYSAHGPNGSKAYEVTSGLKKPLGLPR
jgi:hypothetical protein